MSVAEIGLLHGRYVRLTDRFKAIWTHHQFVSAVYKTFLQQPLPYNVDFQKIYERIKPVTPLTAPPPAAFCAKTKGPGRRPSSTSSSSSISTPARSRATAATRSTSSSP